MRVHVDGDTCQANGLCIQAAPTVFWMGDDDDVVRSKATVDNGEQDAVSEAVDICPVRALSIES